MKFQSDVDIDFADRKQILQLIQHIPASISQQQAHNTGIYPTAIPVNALTGRAAIDYDQAEQRGYIKLDFLNVGVYSQVHSEQHLLQLLERIPPWHKLLEKSFCEQLIHIGNHYDTLCRMPEPVNSIARLAMFLAIIRPAKRYLIGRSWREVGEEIWQKPSDGAYYFKKSHGVAYAHLVLVHMNLLELANQGN